MAYINIVPGCAEFYRIHMMKKGSPLVTSPLVKTGIVSPFCKVCYDAAKTPEIYNSHFTYKMKNKKVIAVCPIIQTNKCSVCRVTGHLEKYCNKAKCIREQKIYIYKRDTQIEVLRSRIPRASPIKIQY